MEYGDLIGVPFVDGGRDKENGFDCWGLAMEMYRRQGVMLKDYALPAVEAARISASMKYNTHTAKDWQKLKKPDMYCIILIKLSPEVWANHVGIYIGGGKFIHAYSPTGVSIARISRWQSRIVGYYKPKRSVKA